MANESVHPVGNRVLVKRSPSKTSKGGIILPDTAQEKPRSGEVVAVGPGKYNEKGALVPVSVALGDQVLFGSYSGVEVKTSDTSAEYLILNEEEIFGVLT